jgi:hypothetical protein
MTARAAAALRFFAGLCLGLLVRAWVFSLRVRVTAPAGFDASDRAVLAFWHGQQMALLGARSLAGKASVLVSRSRDGDLQSGVMTALGFRVVRGSSSRGGARALALLVRALRSGESVALSVDGPRGPRHVAKPGAASAAFASAARLVPVASAVQSSVVLRRAWDAFEIPLPFSRVAIVIGPGIAADEARAEPGRLGHGIEACRRRAEALLPPHAGTAEKEARS